MTASSSVAFCSPAMSSSLGRSRAYGATLHAFSMAFARNTGMSPKAYLKRRLNQEAIQLLLNSDLKIKDVASQLRFFDEFHFSRFFRHANGLAPVQYRRA